MVYGSYLLACLTDVVFLSQLGLTAFRHGQVNFWGPISILENTREMKMLVYCWIKWREGNEGC